MKSNIKGVFLEFVKKILLRENINGVGIDMNNSQIQQRLLFTKYSHLLAQGHPLPKFRDSGFRVYSQTDEDGLLLYIFSVIGFTNKVLVDIAFASPYGANTTNLICNWGWNGLLIHGSDKELESSKKYFKSHPDTSIVLPKLIMEWITAENVNDILVSNGISGGIDLFSLDVDGMDYWIWKSLEAIQPRVVIVECQTMWGHEKSVTVPYKPDFNRFNVHPDYFGASLSAFIKLGREKGYRLVGCNKYGYNAFFVQNGIGEKFLPEISPEECFAYVPSDLQQKRKNRLQSVTNFEWKEV